MSKRYQLVFQGTQAVGNRRVEIMQQVKRLLRLNTQEVITLFEQPPGAVLFETSSHDKAQRLLRTLNHMGARCTLRDTAQPTQTAWQDWRLEDLAQDSSHVFQCHACHYAVRLPIDQPLPTVCPECGVVAAKFAKVADEKRKRERMRQRLIDIERAKERKTIEAEERAQEEALRKEIERQVRRELGLNRRFTDHLRTAALVASVFAVGVGSAMLYNHQLGFDGDAGVATQAPERPGLMVVAENAKTLHLASDLLGALGGAGDRLADPSSPVEGVDTTPWLNAPAPAAGPARQKADETGQAARTDHAGSMSEAEQIAQALRYWSVTTLPAPLTTLRATNLATQLLLAGRIDDAVAATRLAADPGERLTALLALVGHEVLATDAERRRSVERVIRRTFEEHDVEASVVALLALDALHRSAGQADTGQATDARLLSVMRTAQPGTAETVALYALIAAQRAATANPTDTGRWFAEANLALEGVGHTTEQLIALAHLARAYHATGDRPTARRLAVRVRSGINALPADTDAQPAVDQLLQTYTALGSIDIAVDSARLATDAPLQSELRLGELAVHLAARGQRVAALGVVSAVSHPAVSARAHARLSEVAELLGRPRARDQQAEAALDAARPLAHTFRRIIASDFGRAEALGPLPPSTPAADADRQQALVATNLAWRGAADPARQAARDIRDAQLRGDIEQRLLTLAALQTNAEDRQILATR